MDLTYEIIKAAVAGEQRTAEKVNAVSLAYCHDFAPSLFYSQQLYLFISFSRQSQALTFLQKMVTLVG